MTISSRVRLLAAVIVAGMTLSLVAFVAPANAAAPGRYFSNCDALHRVYKHGVAKGPRAAAKQVRDGYGRPATTTKAKAAYWRNESRLDRDNDGTACEA